jgi:hypothetical protein
MVPSVDKMTSSELKRDIMLYARSYPKQFLEMANDPGLARHSNGV